MTSKFVFFKEKMDALYLTENMQTYWIHMTYEYWKEGDTPYYDGFGIFPEWFF